MSSKKTYTIIQADGLYPVSTFTLFKIFVEITKSDYDSKDDDFETKFFNENPTHDYNLEYIQTYLWPPGTPDAKTWSTIPKDLRDRVDGIMVLKMGFTAEDVGLFPKLRWQVTLSLILAFD